MNLELNETKKFFESIATMSDLERLIDEGEAENQYLECKSPLSLQNYNRDMKNEVSKITSGFANTDGGLIIFGVATDTKRTPELDILTQIEPIGSISKLKKLIELSIPLLTEPNVKFETKIIKKAPSDTKGVALLYIYPTNGDPIKSTKTYKFWIRVGDKTLEMPYAILKKMFLGGNSPDLDIEIPPALISQSADKLWNIPIRLKNNSTNMAKNVAVTLEVTNFRDCNTIIAQGLVDESKSNPNKKFYSQQLPLPIYKGLATMGSHLIVGLKGNKQKLELTIKVYAENMVGKNVNFLLYLYKNKKPKVTVESEKFI